jgi:prepilin-type N-terminal cleavage/methylation domain-containing protein
MNNFKHILNNKGLTLIELMIVLVLSLLLMAAVYMTYQLQHGSGQSQLQVAATQQDLRAAMDIIAVDIMNSGANPTFPINQQSLQGITSTSGAASLELVMDLNGNGTTTGATDVGEDIVYNLQGGNLARTSINATGNITQVLANNVTQLNFTYRDAQNTLIVPAGNLTNTQAQTVRFVQVVIYKNSDQIDPQTGQRVPRHLQRIVCKRNG